MALDSRPVDRMPIRYDCVGPGISGDLRSMLGRQIGRARHNPTGKAVNFDQCERNRELIVYAHQNRPAGEFLHPAVETGAAAKIGQDSAAVHIMENRSAGCFASR
jgi:hypothetical protein